MSQKRGKTRKLPKSVRPKEWEILLEVIPKKHKKAIICFLLAYGSGMRVSEVSKCKPEHLRETSILIPDSKYGVDRVVPLPKGWRKNMANYLPLGVSIRTLQRWFDKYRDKAKLNKKYTFHSLRHGFATRLLENGTPINQVSLALGHADISTTSIYTKASPTDLLKSYEDLF